MDLPLFKKNEFYPMIWGVRETEIPMGMRSVGTGNVYYVDYDHNLANDDNTGVDPDNPLKTIQAAVDRVDDYDFIVVRSIDPSGEQVVTSGDADHVTIIGCGDSRYTPTWTTGTGEYCLVLNNDGWKVSGFRFLVLFCLLFVYFEYTNIPLLGFCLFLLLLLLHLFSMYLCLPV